ncbi:thiamine pyrophosphate-binding protein [Castellaniella sp.]|uniref:thiamine pyrophosphate-binding protein n=1 Tax=Castellaniella sp. TaxID=1955812 RepID=UPI00355F656B
MKVYEVIARALKDAMDDVGIEHLFGLIGDANLYMVDSYMRDCGGTYVRAVHEAGATAMGVGYAQVRNTIGVATVTQGPGLTNTLTALLEGVKSATPMVLLAGDTAEEDHSHIQFINQRELVMSAGIGFEQLRTPHTIVQDLHRAFRRAWVERRPIVFNMPYNFQWMDADYQRHTLRLPEVTLSPTLGDDMDHAVGIIAFARQPVVLAGRAAADEATKHAIQRFAARIGAPLATTVRAKDLFIDDPFNLGICGTLSNEIASDVLMNSDCIIAFGAGLNKYTGGLGSFFDQKKRIVHISPHAGDIGRYTPVEAGLVGDPGRIADQMVELLDEAEIPASANRSDELAERIRNYRQKPRLSDQNAPGTVDILELFHALNTRFPHDRIYLTDGGRYEYIAWVDVKVRTPRDFVHTICYGAIGLGLPTAIGASVAGAGKPTLLVVGDGGLELGGMTELMTARRQNLNLVVVVCNDGSYGAEYEQFVARGLDPELTMLGSPDFAPIAQAMGVASMTVRSTEDLDAAMRFINERDGRSPCLIDVKLDPRYMNL